MPPSHIPPPPLRPRASRAAPGLPAIRSIPLGQPLKWLACGVRDLRHGGWLSLLDGLLPALFGGLLVLLARDRFWRPACLP